MNELQESICVGLEALEPRARFGRDAWERPGGGGGLTRVISDGEIFEKGGVNVSRVHGEFPDDFARTLPGDGTSFFATGVSLVLHPNSPHIPTVHANFRYLEHGEKCWFGGGADLTPYYFHEEDKAHFHGAWRDACGRHECVADFERFRDRCDRYFYLPHRGERRGVGGIFFDYLFAHDDFDSIHAFVRDAGSCFLDAYVPIVKRRADTPVTPEQRHWQELRRGRYVEFNLVFDRGTLFGLKTNGRTESILMSLPPRVRWEYQAEPEPNTPEAALLEELRKPPPPEESTVAAT